MAHPSGLIIPERVETMNEIALQRSTLQREVKTLRLLLVEYQDKLEKYEDALRAFALWHRKHTPEKWVHTGACPSEFVGGFCGQGNDLSCAVSKKYKAATGEEL